MQSGIRLLHTGNTVSQFLLLKGKDIRICMDEWNYWYGPEIYGELGTRYFFRDAMGIAAGLNEYSKNSDIILYG